MTAATVAPSDRLSAHLADLRGALSRLGEEAGRYSLAKLDQWRLQVERPAEPSHPADAAVVEGVEAAVTGGNPLRAAWRGAWSTADAAGKVKLVAVLLLVALLAPVVLLLLLLALLIGAATGTLPNVASYVARLRAR